MKATKEGGGKQKGRKEGRVRKSRNAEIREE